MKEKEHQSIEWKESWQDEYLKWICGYANAYGGTIYIGTDDDGNVVGIDNARDLLERIPNKITDTMGIIVDVNLLYKGELEYLQIIVDKYPSLISFHGKYYYRSGSTMREITGKELERALLKTQGRTWDGVPLPKLSVSDLKQDASLIGSGITLLGVALTICYTDFTRKEDFRKHEHFLEFAKVIRQPGFTGEL